MTRDRIGRITGLCLFSLMLLLQLKGFFDVKAPLGYLRWSLVTILFALFFSAYVIRSQAVVYANKIRETVLPLFCAGLPMGIILVPDLIYNYQINIGSLTFIFMSYSENFIIEGMVLMAIGEIITIIGMFSLKRSFSIFTEVRNLVTTGIYRYIRHPLYSGEILSMVGFLILYPTLWSIATVSFFVIFQSIRAKNEEKKIAKEFPSYQSFKNATGFIWPKFPGYKEHQE
jgi:protein-S-isoprenylcysteine O-methyltransferase Ste14